MQHTGKPAVPTQITVHQHQAAANDQHYHHHACQRSSARFADAGIATQGRTPESKSENCQTEKIYREVYPAEMNEVARDESPPFTGDNGFPVQLKSLSRACTRQLKQSN